MFFSRGITNYIDVIGIISLACYKYDGMKQVAVCLCLYPMMYPDWLNFHIAHVQMVEAGVLDPWVFFSWGINYVDVIYLRIL